MASLEVVTSENKKAGTVDVSSTVFEAAVKPHLFHAEVRRQLSRRQRGTHSTKNRAAVSGGGAKPWRQKGTGRARQGTIRAPQWAGGGVVFGPVPRSYEHVLPKKVRRAALRSAVSMKLRDDDLIVLEAFDLDEYKTSRVVHLLDKLGLAGKGALIVIDEANDFIERSARNLPYVSVNRVAGLNVYDVLRHKKLVVTKAALEALERRLGDAPKGAQA